MKKIFTACLLLISAKSFSQSANVQSAANSYKSYNDAGVNEKLREISDAKKYIDLAAENSSTANDPKMWFYRGKIYLAISRDTSSGIKQLDPDAPEKSTVGFINCLKTDSRNYYSDDAKNLLWASGVTLFNRAVSLYNKGEYEKAIRFYNVIFDVFPYDKENNLKRNNITPDVLNMNIYLAYRKAKDNAQAKAYLQKLIDVKYNEPMIYIYMSRIMQEEKDTAKALTYIEQGRKLYEDNSKLMTEELNLYILTGKSDVLIQKLTDALNNNPDNEQYYFFRGKLYDDKKENEKAIADYKKAIELKSDYFDANYNLGIIYFNQGASLANAANNIKDNKEYEKAKQQYEKLFKTALPYLEKASELQPKDYNTLVSLKTIYARLGENEKYAKVKAALEEVK